ncbi:MAG: type II secretion system F family protein [bacterium]
MSTGSIILLSILALCAGGIVFVLYRLKKKEAKENLTVKERIRPYVDQAYREELARQRSTEEEEESISFIEGISDKISDAALSEEIKQGIKDWLLRAGMRVRPAEFLIITLSIMCINAAVFASLGWYFIGGYIGPMSLIGFAIGWAYPLIYVIIKRSQRMSKFNDQLLDLITLMSNSLKSGYGFMQSLNLVADEAQPPASDEFNRVVRENNLGVPIDKALTRLVERMDSEDLDLMVTAVLIQRETGGNLSEILDNISDTIRERIKLQGQIQALTAQGKLGGAIISGLPVVLGVVFYFLRTEMMTNFVTHPWGIMAIAAGVFWQAIGIFIIWNIVNIDV